MCIIWNPFRSDLSIDSIAFGIKFRLGACWVLSLALAVTVGVVIGFAIRSDTDIDTVPQVEHTPGVVERRIIEAEAAPGGVPEAVSGQKEEAGRVDFREALRKAFRHSDTTQSWIEYYVALDKWLNADTVHAAIAETQTLRSESERNQRLAVLIERWARFDPHAALDYAMNDIGGRPGRKAAFLAVRERATKDPVAALAWSKEHEGEDGTSYMNLERGALIGWMEEDQDAAWRYLQTLETGDTRETAVQDLTREYYAGSSMDDTIAWVQSIADDEMRGQALEALANRWAHDLPEKAAAWFATLTDSALTKDAVTDIARTWAKDDPESTAEWLVGLPEGPGQSEGMQRLVREWVKNDPNAAGEWLNTLPDNKSLDLALDAFAREAVEDDPESAITWADSIHEEERRSRSLIDIGQEWYREDPQAASRWVLQQNLPDHLKTAIMNPPPKEDTSRAWVPRTPGE